MWYAIVANPGRKSFPGIESAPFRTVYEAEYRAWKSISVFDDVRWFSTSRMWAGYGDKGSMALGWVYRVAAELNHWADEESTS